MVNTPERKLFPSVPASAPVDQTRRRSELWFVRNDRERDQDRPWTLYRINLDGGKTATTFDEQLANDDKIMKGQRVKVLIEPNKRKPGTWKYLDFEEIPQPETADLWPEEPKAEEPL